MPESCVKYCSTVTNTDSAGFTLEGALRRKFSKSDWNSHTLLHALCLWILAVWYTSGRLAEYHVKNCSTVPGTDSAGFTLESALRRKSSKSEWTSHTLQYALSLCKLAVWFTYGRLAESGVKKSSTVPDRDSAGFTFESAPIMNKF